MIQNCRCRNTRSHNGSFHFHGLRRKLIPEFLISGDLLNSLFRVTLSSSVSRLYFSWNALQKISRNSCTLSPVDCMAFRTSFISSSAGVVSGALSMSFSWTLRIRDCAKAALTDGEAIAGKLTDTCEAEQKGQREALERSLTKDEERIEVLEKMVLRLYEDMVAGRISEANFNLMLDKTQKEQAELKERVAQGRKKLADEMRLAMDAKQWVDAIQEYADITELDAATLNRLIKEIVVHEHIDSDKTRHISIEIHFNLKPIPEVEQVKG